MKRVINIAFRILDFGFRIMLVHYFALNNIDEVVKSGQKD
jgi:hypothetical protein